ncbi:MAG: chromosome segregation protein SMC [Clostridia bacterium]|nr:chromosome segregation protein SMC [Clostridia bacterium]
MRLKKLEIYGFKSFAQRTEVIFNGGITGIVGPNGSGKSNIGDAVKWVLGEQNPRELRGGSMQDVIFNGTEKRKKLAYAEVTLIFENDDGALKTNFAEVAVTRRLYRSGESEYYLNKTACRLRDIKELFYDTGVGKDGYSNIGQGRIDDILSNNSEDRREVFEEAAGISTFRVRKEEAERKLSRTLDNLDRVNDILEELGGRIEPLHEQAQSALKYQELSGKLKTLEMNIFLLKHGKLSERMNELHEAMEQLRDEMLQHEARLQENSAERAAIDEAVQILDDEIGQARAESRMRTEELHQLQTACERAHQREESLRGEIARLQEDALSRRERLNELGKMTREGEGADEAAALSLENAKKSLEKTQQEADAAAARADEAERVLDQHKADILSAVNRLSDARNTQTQKQAMCQQMETYLTQLQGNEGELAAQGDALKVQYDEALKLQDEAQKEFKAVREEAQKLELNVRSLVAEGEEKTSRMQQLAMNMQSARSRLKVLTEMARDMEGYANAVRRALQFAQGDKNVCGVVAQLMQVPKELEVALDAVMGGSLQNIVTTDDVTAKRLIEYLKRSESGRATFLPISNIRPHTLNNEERRVLSMPGCLGVASELITYDSRYQPIMENLLGRTVVAQDLDSALPIMRAGRYAFRLVTLDGQVMHSGGSMTGGSMRGKTSNFLSREREIKELTAKLAQDEKTLESLRADMNGMQQRQAEARRLRDEATHTMHQQEIAVAREQERVFNASTELQAHEQRLMKTRTAINQLTDSIEEIKQDLLHLSQGTQSATVDREELDRRTEELQKELRAAREQADDLRERVTQEKLRYAEMEHSIETLRRDKARWAEESQNHLSALSRIEQKAQERAAEADDTHAQLQQLLSAVEEQKTAAEQAETESNQLEGERQEKLAKQRELMQESEDLHDRHTQDGDKLHRTEILFARAENEMNTLTEHMWNTYEATLASAEEYRLPEGTFSLTSGEREAGGIRREIRDLGPINAHAVEEYAQTKERFDEMSRQKEDMTQAESDLRGLIKRLLSQMEKQFVAEFDKLNENFKETFVRLFGGGQAELKLTDPNDPLSCGIEVVAQPPGKKLQLLSLLSGGERALTAIAILFAMLKVKPTPFCILDEIEAALDEANISYFADYLVEFAKTTQFVVVTHRKGTMERCDALYGVAMEEKGVSSMVSVNLENYN